MALTRSFLEALGIEAPKIEEIIRGHTESVTALKDKISGLENQAKKADGVQKELDALKAEISSGKNPEKAKFDALKKEYDAYKEKTEKEAENRAKTAAVRSLLKDIGVSEKRLDTVLKVTSLDDIKLTEKGEIENASDLKKSMKTEWADFITSEETHGVGAANPPANNGGGYKSVDEIMAIKDDQERQAAIAANHEMFGF